MESSTVQTEIVNLLKEIKEILKVRHDQLQSTETAGSRPEEESSSVMENISVGKSRRPSHSGGSSSSQCLSSRHTSEDPGEAEDALRFDGMNRIKYYEIHSRLEYRTEFEKDWKYWRPILTFAFVKSIAEVKINKTDELLARGRGRPDYIPEWEIVQVEGEWYHIDGMKLASGINFSPDAEFEVEERLVPYSLLPSRTDLETSPQLSGLNEQHKLLSVSLGNLHSAPAHMIRLKFEKTYLRATAKSRSFHRDLKAAEVFFRSLRLHEGTFEIVDIDESSSFTVYDPRNQLEGFGDWTSPSGKVEDPRVLMAGAALAAEESEVNVNPVLCTLRKRAGEPAVIMRQGASRWYRIISLQGLAAIVDLGYAQPTAQKRFSLTEAFQIIFREYIYTLSCVGYLHIACMAGSEAANPYELDWAPFHITWFRIEPDRKWPEFSNWKSGRLYGTSMDSEVNNLEEVAFTMCFYPSKGGDAGDFNEHDISVTTAEYMQYVEEPDFWYWCILVLAPTHFKPFHGRSTNRPAIENGGHLAPLGLILEALQDAVNSWEAIADHLALLVNKRAAIFVPDMHDQLLFDDDAFSRSRLYIWAIDSLEIFIPTIAANIREWEVFWKTRKIFFDWASEDSVIRGDTRMINKTPYEGVVQKVEEQVIRLTALKTRMELLREQTKTLRDGLFNASAVIESRAATELGQNVRLLTYVSIFYLPLSFCATAWSINYTYHTVVFVVVTILFSGTTYLVVMNLNNFARLGRGLYRQSRNKVIRSMVNDDEWASVGERFSRFRPERENDSPSEWQIFIFAVSQLWKRILSAGLWLHNFVVLYSWKRIAGGLLGLPKKILKLIPKKQTDDVENDVVEGGTPA